MRAHEPGDAVLGVARSLTRRAADAESLAGLGEVHGWLLVVKGLEEGEAAGSCRATMAKAFLKMSFCLRSPARRSAPATGSLRPPRCRSAASTIARVPR